MQKAPGRPGLSRFRPPAPGPRVAGPIRCGSGRSLIRNDSPLVMASLDGMTDLATDLAHLRRAIAVADAARSHGNHPFGAILVAPDGSVALEAENTVVTDSDITGHAETNLVRLAGRAVALDELPGCTLYTSCEPCAMCSGAIYWSGIGRMVYALPEDALYALTGDHPENPTLALPARTVLAAGSRAVDVSGPHLEAEAAASHEGFWG
jgi:tRNA(Arg) A34 adenosine deaminase TadA